MFELVHVSRSFASQVALDDVTLRIEPGRTTMLIGPSGCGKSTLLRLLIGLLAPSRGQVLIDGEPLSPQRLPALRQRVGYVIQEGGLFPHLDARENIVLMARHLGWSQARIHARVAELTELTHFPSAALSRFPGQLSGGQNQRVALMRALMLEPEALLLDEPLGALDPMIRHDLQEELAGIFASLGKTVVMVTHDLAEAAFLGDHIVLLRDGRLLQSGSVDTLLRHPADAFVERFVRAQRSHVVAPPA